MTHFSKTSPQLVSHPLIMASEVGVPFILSSHLIKAQPTKHYFKDRLLFTDMLHQVCEVEHMDVLHQEVNLP